MEQLVSVMLAIDKVHTSPHFFIYSKTQTYQRCSETYITQMC